MAKTGLPDHPSRMPSDFALVVACCRWAFAGGETQRIHELARAANWDVFLHLSRRHRVQGLIWHCLRSVTVPLPLQATKSLSEDASAIGQQNLLAAVGSAELLKSFNRAAIPFVFVKGLTLAKLAYSNPFRKMSSDVDILVPEDAVPSAAAELDRLGFKLLTPAGDPEASRLQAWHRRVKESDWAAPSGFQLDLHSRLADSPELIPTIGVNSAQQTVEIHPGISLPTLALEELFAYLCVHGASSAWFRLKWITDLAALLHDCTSEQIRRLYERSQELGAGRAAAQALLLARHLYGTKLDANLAQELEGDRINRWLVRIACSEMMREPEPTEIRFGTAWIHLAQFLLRPGLRFKLGELRRQIGEAASNRI